MISFLNFYYLILPNEYSWLESYINNDHLWLNNNVNWEEAFDLILNDFTFFSLFNSSFFINTYIFIDHFVKLSFLDLILLTEINKLVYCKAIYDSILWDISTSFSYKFFFVNFLFYTDYQDYIITLLYYSPELILALNDYITFFWSSNFFAYTPAAVYDLFSDNMVSVVSEFLEYFCLFFFFIWFMIFFLNIFQIIKWNNSTEIYMNKIFYYLFSISKENRIQFEVMLYTFFFFVFYWTMMVATFDDDQEEIIELFDSSFFVFFCVLIIYLVYKYSLHYFAFLEATDTEGRSVSFIAKQFFKDFLGTFALLLRFFILLFRLNVYDNLDDFYDSYYIFVGDFDDDEYFTELFFSYHTLFFYEYDNNDDGSFSLEDENEFFSDLFYIYFLCWSKFFFFIFFILEEILRLSLAFYICYLIVFEVHAVNCSYLEDNYFIKKRFKFENKKRKLFLFKFRF